MKLYCKVKYIITNALHKINSLYPACICLSVAAPQSYSSDLTALLAAHVTHRETGLAKSSIHLSLMKPHLPL
jgi:hypothetical protein